MADFHRRPGYSTSASNRRTLCCVPDKKPRRPTSPRSPFTAIDLFCGAGGLTSGFLVDGEYDVKLGLDNDADSAETYRANFGSVAKVIRKSIFDVSPEEVRDLAGNVDVVLGGPSCQSFSTHGRKNGWVLGDPRSDLWSSMHAMVAALRPRAFIMENVPGLLYYAKGAFAGKIFAAFERLGYQLHHDILLAADFGVPQLRRRLFVVGVEKGTEFRFPSPARLGGWRRDTLAKWERERAERRLLPHLTLREALHDLPNPAADLDAGISGYGRRARRGSLAAHLRGESPGVTDHVASPVPEHLASLLGYIPQGGTWRDIPPHFLPDRFRRMRRTDGTNLLGRLAWDRPAYTVTTQFNNATTGCFLHPENDRVLTVREGARLQTFTDSHIFSGSLQSRYRQVGNAVPPLMARVMAAALADALRGRTPRKTISVGCANGVPSPSSLAIARRMSAQKKHDTRPEASVRKAFWSRGVRYRKQYPVPGMPRRSIDIAIPKNRVAVFVHGCFWHQCPQHSQPTKSNTKWWVDKIERNKQRDAETTAHLQSLNWRVFVVWEHEDPEVAVSRIMRELELSHLDREGCAMNSTTRNPGAAPNTRNR